MTSENTQTAKSFLSPFLRKVLICLIAGCFYGFANYLSGKYYLPGCSFAEMRPQVALPMFLGVLFGPWAGFVCGCFGDMIGYWAAGKGPLFAPHWSLANGLMGLIPSLIFYWKARPVETIASFTKLLVLLLAASSLPFIFSISIELISGAIGLRDAIYRLFLPIFITDTIWAFILIPMLMYRGRLLIIRIELRTILIVFYLLIATVLLTWLSSVIITMHDELKIQELYSLGGMTLLVLIIGLGISAISAKKITSPVILLTDLADRVAGGNYSDLPKLQDIVTRSDELGTLAKVFTNMVKSVQQREEVLRRRVDQLTIEIDRKKQNQDLKKITESDYFKRLKQKAGDLRREAGEKKNRTDK